MKKLIVLAVTALIVVSCQISKPLYNWEKYDRDSYTYLKKNDDKSAEKLIKTYDKIIKKQHRTRQVVPPGIYADYGLLLIERERVDEGKKMLEKEIELYPESKIFIDRILKTLE